MQQIGQRANNSGVSVLQTVKYYSKESDTQPTKWQHVLVSESLKRATAKYWAQKEKERDEGQGWIPGNEPGK